jgi:isoquinoline 1-oxidoreductase beta subunit
MPDMIECSVNGRAISLSGTHADEPLLWALRDRLGLRGTKYGCGHGGCGACLVQIDGEAKPSCMVPVKDVAGCAIVTIEGIAARTDSPIMRAWLAEQVPQCGYCQPGMIVAASALLAHKPHPTDTDIDAALSHVLCRCGVYHRARRAIHRAATGHFEDAPFPDASLPGTEAKCANVPVFVFNPWVKIADDGQVTVVLGRSEMGQGIATALPMLVAEELEVPMLQIRTEFAPADHAYDNPAIGLQITVGSTSIQTSWEPLRRAGAEVRERLIVAAARNWDAKIADCRAEAGTVIHEPSGRRLDYGVLAHDASLLPAPPDPRLKRPEDFRIIGKPTARLEIPGHITGRTIFGIDIAMPGMMAATVRLRPSKDAKRIRFDASKALAVAGVRNVIEITEGVAVIADDFWSALQGREALDVAWEGGETSDLSSGGISQALRGATDREGLVERNHGAVEGALAKASVVLEASYETPYQAHVPIEPINCAARVADGRCDVWVSTQGQTLAQTATAQAAALPVEAVEIHSTFLGGGFGRRSVPDVVAQAVEIAKICGQPIHLLWTRAEDIRHDRYRPASFTKFRGGLDGDGQLIAWFQRVAGPKLAFEGINIPYAIPNLRIETVDEDPGIPTGYWRSVGASQNAFSIECFIDELAHEAAADPLEFRLKLLGDSPRHHRVLALAAEKAGWSKPVPAGRGRGLAVYYAHGGWVAEIAEVSLSAEGLVRVHKVVCAIDCGLVVNPDTVKAQLEGGVAFGLTAALKSAITIKDGQAVETGFRDYPLLNISEMPEVEVHIVASDEPPSGAGEGGVPPMAPAVANALFALTRQRVRSLPIHLEAR